MKIMPHSYTAGTELELVLAVQSGRKREADRLARSVSALLWQLSLNHHPPSEVLRNELLGAIGTITRHLVVFQGEWREFTTLRDRYIQMVIAAGTPDELRHLFIEYVGLLVRLHAPIQDPTSQIWRCVAFIRANPGAVPSADDMASICHMSRFHFSRVFKRCVGITFREYLIRVRMDLCCRLLEANPDLQIQDVAHAAGFSDSQYFSRVFKQRIGVAPSGYRRLAGTRPDSELRPSVLPGLLPGDRE